MKVKVEMVGGKGRVSFEMELEPKNSYPVELFFDKALEAYKVLEEAEMERRMA